MVERIAKFRRRMAFGSRHTAIKERDRIEDKGQRRKAKGQRLRWL
jgi:hypothetical protein